jgi:hypothetical protein
MPEFCANAKRELWKSYLCLNVAKEDDVLGKFDGGEYFSFRGAEGNDLLLLTAA